MMFFHCRNLRQFSGHFKVWFVLGFFLFALWKVGWLNCFHGELVKIDAVRAVAEPWVSDDFFVVVFEAKAGRRVSFQTF